MDKQTYTQRVQDLAEKMAMDHYLHNPQERAMMFVGVTFSQLPMDVQKQLVEIHITKARIAVAEMAEAVTLALQQDYPGEEKTGGVIHNWLKEQGLIPDNAQEGEQNG